MGNNCCTYDVTIPTLWFYDFEKTLPEMKGKRVAITGCSSGMGLVAAQTLAKSGAEIFMLNLESEKPEEVRKKVQFYAPGSVLHHIGIDLTSFASVRAAAEVLKSKCESLDVLCCNAGLAFVPDQATGDGYNLTMQVNHLSHFLLVKEMLPALQAAAKEKGEARVVTHSSYARVGTPLNEAFYGPNGGKLECTAAEAYHQSKLANILFIYALEARLAKMGSKIKAICCAPGVAATAITKNMTANGGSLPGFKYCSCIAASMSQSQEDGTMPILKSIADKEVESGDMFLPSMGRRNEWKGPVRTLRRPLPKEDHMCEDAGSQEKLWAASEKAIGEQFVVA